MAWSTWCSWGGARWMRAANGRFPAGLTTKDENGLAGWPAFDLAPRTYNDNLLRRRAVEVGNGHRGELAVGGSGQRGGVGAEVFASPPETLRALLLRGGKPVLVKDGADVLGGMVRERVAAEQAERFGAVFEEAELGAG